MSSNTPSDYQTKLGLLEDVFTILDLEKVLKGDEMQVGGFDLIYFGQPLKSTISTFYSTTLGAVNDRQDQLRKLAKKTASRLIKKKAES